MSIKRRGGKVILKDGKLITDCDCCPGQFCFACTGNLIEDGNPGVVCCYSKDSIMTVTWDLTVVQQTAQEEDPDRCAPGAHYTGTAVCTVNGVGVGYWNSLDGKVHVAPDCRFGVWEGDHIALDYDITLGTGDTAIRLRVRDGYLPDGSTDCCLAVSLSAAGTVPPDPPDFFLGFSEHCLGAFLGGTITFTLSNNTCCARQGDGVDDPGECHHAAGECDGTCTDPPAAPMAPMAPMAAPRTVTVNLPPRPRPAPPDAQPMTVARAIHGAAGIAKAVFGAGGASEEMITQRTDVCAACPHAKLVAGLVKRCGLCGCGLWAKIRNAGERCPDGRW